MMGEYLDDAFNSWLGEAWSCCSPSIKRDGDIYRERRGAEKHMTILHDQQPRLVPPPSSDPPGRPSKASSSRELLDRGHNYASFVSKRAAFSVRRKLNAYNGIRSRRPQVGRPMQISNPSDFKHVGMAIPRRPSNRFRPLQLSIYLPENQLSPILPHFQEFGDDESILTYPSQAIVSHSRSGSAMSSFSIPRKPLNSSISRLQRISARNSVDEHESPTSTSSEWAMQPLKPPPRIPESPSTQELMAALEAQLPRAPPAARVRNAEPPPLVRTAEQYGRVKSALIEREELENQLKQLDTIIEQRRSLYLSRSSRGTSIYNQFSETSPPTPRFPNTREVSTPVQMNERPKTAPNKPVSRMPLRAISAVAASSAFNSHPPISRSGTPQENNVSRESLDKALPTLPPSHFHNPNYVPPSRPQSSRSAPAPPPPLPLMLHSPPAKSRSVTPRKSFSRSRSRVSNWLLRSGSSVSNSTNGDEKDRHRRTVSNDSITNSPKPITSKEGFYQCIDLNAPAARNSISDRSLSTVMTEERSYISGDDGEREVDGIFDESEAEGTRTVPTTNWSAQSSPGRVSDIAMRKEMEYRVGRMRSFDDTDTVDEKELVEPHRTNVGVAF